MHIVFGMAADGRVFPEHPGPDQGIVGGAVVGPSGLLDLLATGCGLAGPAYAPLLRIAIWQRKLEAADETRQRFWSASLKADPWSTARLLLSWRDNLAESGWGPAALAAPPARLADIAAAETSGPELPRGQADLLREVIRAVQAGEPVCIDRVELIDDLEQLPPGWRTLMCSLSAAGVCVTPAEPCDPLETTTDLGRLHRYLCGGGRENLQGDGSVVLAEADTAIMAAECVAEWLACDEAAGRGSVIISPDGDSSLLDQALARRGLPALGLSAKSQHRGALQVLSLAFSLAWAPFDPGKLLELLRLPRPPMSRWAAGLLVNALAKEPGMGGPAWQSSWRRIEERLRERAAGDEEFDAEEALTRWRAWLDVGRFDRKAGMPANEAVALCGRVLDWAVATDAGRRDPLLLCVVGAARSLSAALAALGRTPVTSLQIDRMIDQALAEGLPNPDHEGQEGHVRAASCPGALWGGAPRVVWWNFAGGPTTAMQFPWSERERAALEAAGCCPELPAAALHREASQAQNAVLSAREALLLVRPAMDRGTEATSHPLAHRLSALLAGREGICTAKAEGLFREERVPLAAREIIRSAATRVELPEPQAVWNLGPTVVGRIANRQESATSFSDLMQCQLRWVLKHLAGLRADSGAAVPRPERLFGNLAHALSQAVFLVGVVPDPDRVKARALEEFDGLVDRIAAPLRLPGHAGELAFAKRRIPDALAALAMTLAERGMMVEGVEVEHEHAFGDLKVRSRIDLVVRGPDGRRAVVDLKWTSGLRRFRGEIEAGRAIQLATYSRLLDPDGGVPAAYFLLRQRRLLAEAGSPLASDGIVVERNLDRTWDGVVRDFRTMTSLARDGHALSAGVAGVNEHLPEDLAFPPEEAVCTYCDLGRVCRMSGQ